MWSNYVELVESYDLFLYTRNSIIVSAVVIVGNVLSSAFVAYGFARLRARGSTVLFALVLSTMMLPFQVTMVPMYLLFNALGWLDSFLPLIVPPFFGNAFLIFMLRQFFRSIPRDFSEAARIDGCSEFRIFGQIFLPLSIPALTTVAIFSFIWAWNDFLGPLIYLSKRDLQTLALAIAKLQEMPAFAFSHFNYAMGLSFVSLLPCIVVFFLAQRYYIEGIIVGGIKG
jgi:ABC-type glycerol-3-phosphate transport system permease component